VINIDGTMLGKNVGVNDGISLACMVGNNVGNFKVGIWVNLEFMGDLVIEDGFIVGTFVENSDGFVDGTSVKRAFVDIELAEMAVFTIEIDSSFRLCIFFNLDSVSSNNVAASKDL